MTPTALLPLDLRELLRSSTELRWGLGNELLWGDWAAPVERGGVGAAEMSMAIGSRGPFCNCGGSNGVV